MQVRGPIGMTKKRRPSSAKNVSTRRLWREPIDDEVHALGERRGWCASSAPPRAFVGVDERAAGVDRATRDRTARSRARHRGRARGRPTRRLPPRRAERLDVVGRDAAVVERAPDEVPDEARVVVVEVGVGVLEAAVAPGADRRSALRARWSTCASRRRGARVKKLPMIQYSHVPSTSFQSPWRKPVGCVA